MGLGVIDCETFCGVFSVNWGWKEVRKGKGEEGEGGVGDLVMSLPGFLSETKVQLAWVSGQLINLVPRRKRKFFSRLNFPIPSINTKCVTTKKQESDTKFIPQKYKRLKYENSLLYYRTCEAK